MLRSLRATALALILVLAACGDSGTSPTDDPTEDPTEDPTDGPDLDPEPDPETGTFCGQLGYHCNAADVPTEVFERSDELLEGAKARVESGEDNDAAAEWLRQQDGVTDVAASPSAVVFRVEGGQPTWLLTPSDDVGAAASTGPGFRYEQDVVGHGTPRENPEQHKKALVLAPFLFQFQSNDPGPGIASILRGNRDYAHGDGVRVIQNTTAPALPSGDSGVGVPTVEDFRGWDGYDVIAVSTHGAEMGAASFGCSLFSGDVFCIAGVSTGERIVDCTVIKRRYPDTPGVRCARTSGVEGLFFLLDTDFFAWEYGTFAAGLNKSIVYMGGCQTFKNGSLAYQLAGNSSEYFGWDQNVYVSEMRAPAIRLFQLMVTDGLKTEDAFALLRSEGGHSTTKADMDLRTNGGGLHIREITTLKNPLHPSVSQASGGFALPRMAMAGAAAGAWAGGGPAAADGEGDLDSGEVLPFVGQAGDNENDELFFYVDVDGVRPGAEDDYDVTVEVNEQEIGTFSLDSDEARRIDDSTVRIRIRQPLDFDVQKGQTIQLKATTNLPDDGESEHEVTPVLENPLLVVRSTLESFAAEGTILSEVKAEIDLFMDEGDTPDELTLGKSVGPLEYVRFDVQFPTPAGCSFETSTVDGRLELREGEVAFDDPQHSDFGVPDEILLIVYPEIEETLRIMCDGFAQNLDMIHWFAAFVSLHGGALGGENELDQGRGGFVIRNWETGQDGVYARKSYSRTLTEDEVTLREETTLELRGPTAYGGN